MTLAGARAELKKPLVFGNDAQIKALQYLEKIAELAEEVRKCTYCKGTGRVRGNEYYRADFCFDCLYDVEEPLCTEVVKFLKEERRAEGTIQV